MEGETTDRGGGTTADDYAELCKIILGEMPVTPRPYQAEAFCKIVQEFEDGKPSTLLVLPTGTGKTVLFLMVAKWVIDRGGRVLVMAHRGELITQAANAAGAVGLTAAIEKADEHARPDLTRGDAAPLLPLFHPDAGSDGELDGCAVDGDPKLVIASVQTLQRKRLESWPPGHFDLVIADECFPAGTPIDGRPIETIRVGDAVLSFNEGDWIPERRRVVRLFRRRPSGLVRVVLSDGRNFVCTPDHPVFTYSVGLSPCYVAARDLSPYNMVYGITPPHRGTRHGDQAEGLRGLRDDVPAAKLELHHDSDVFGGVQGETACGAGQDGDAPLPVVRQAGRVPGPGRPGAGDPRPGLLRRRLQGPVHVATVVGTDGRDEPDARRGSDAAEESDARPRCQGEDADDAAGDGMGAAGSRRERPGSDCPPTSSGVGSRVAYGIRRPDGQSEGQPGRASLSLQGGHRQLDAPGGDRSGRPLARVADAQGAGPAEGNLSPVARVVRVEVLEPGSDGRFGGLCPDGFVYNLEVEGNHNYFADGFLVHNCHHASAESYRRVIDHLKPKWYLGVTATWDRGDKTPICGPGQPFETLAFEYSLAEAIESGYLARVVFECLPTGVDLSSIRTTAGDLNAGDLEAAIKPHIEVLVNTALPSLEGRTFIVFTPDVGSADAVASAFRSLGVSCASVCGADADRDAIIGEFKSGRWRGVANCALLCEGFDYPPVDAIVMMRPTKSRSLFTQMVGRGTRTFPGKADCLVIGFNWKTYKHKLVHPVELFAAEPDVAAEAAGLIDAGGDTADVLLAVHRAAEAKKERVRLALEVEARKRAARSIRFDPLAFDPDFLPPDRETAPAKWEAKATENQVNALVRAGMKADEVVDWTKGRASGVLSALAKRRERNLASYKQVQFMKRLGVPDATKLTFEQATAEINRRVGRAG
jgi:superfamily II DNA or RNA helicase